MKDAKQFAQEHAKQLGEKTLRIIGNVLQKHDAGIIEGVIEEIDERDATIASLTKQLAELREALPREALELSRVAVEEHAAMMLKLANAEQDLAERDKTIAGLRASWRCFHCNEVFTTEQDARSHFGFSEFHKPSCCMKMEAGDKGLAAQLREALDDASRLRDEISDESAFEKQYHARLESDIKYLAKQFRECRTLRDVFNVYDSMEGRALAAEERLAEARRNEARKPTHYHANCKSCVCEDPDLSTQRGEHG